jgi:hypothetical protein
VDRLDALAKELIGQIPSNNANEGGTDGGLARRPSCRNSLSVKMRSSRMEGTGSRWCGPFGFWWSTTTRRFVRP